MTGAIHVQGVDSLRYQTSAKAPHPDDLVFPPRFCKFILYVAASSTSPSTQIAFVDPRRLGRIRLVERPLEEPPISLLGPDPLLSPPSAEEFAAALGKRKMPIKSLLLDQAVVCGVGNWVADEILWHARIHPLSISSSLSPADVGQYT